MTIGFFFNWGYWWLFMAILLMAIDHYFIDGY
jgi:hypothetical protein